MEPRPQFYSDLYTFTSAPNSYTLAGNFGTPHGAFWTFEGGDLAIRPIPAPGTAALLGMSVLIAGAIGADRRVILLIRA